MEDVYLNIDDVRKRAYEIAKSCKSSFVYSPMLLLAGIEIVGTVIADELELDKNDLYKAIKYIYGVSDFSEDNITMSTVADNCFDKFTCELKFDRQIKVKDFIKIITEEDSIKAFTKSINSCFII